MVVGKASYSVPACVLKDEASDQVVLAIASKAISVPFRNRHTGTSGLLISARLPSTASTTWNAFPKQLETLAISQLNWTLGLNLVDSSMVNGVGRNNPPYMYFDSWEFTNATGGLLADIVSDAVFHQAIIPTTLLGLWVSGLVLEIRAVRSITDKKYRAR